VSVRAREPGLEPSPDATVTQLTAQLGVQAATLAGREIALAKAELRATARQAVRGGIPLLAAALLGGSAWLVLLAAAILGISEALPAWAAALIVAALLGTLGGALALFGGRRLDRIQPGLPLTTESLRQSVREITHRARRS
jgi:hypothetical protein